MIHFLVVRGEPFLSDGSGPYGVYHWIILESDANQTPSGRQEKQQNTPTQLSGPLPHFGYFDSGKIPRPNCDVSPLPWQRRQTFRGDLTAEPGSRHMTRGPETRRATESHLLSEHDSPDPAPRPSP